MSGFVASLRTGKMFEELLVGMKLEFDFVIHNNQVLIEFFHRLFGENSVLFQISEKSLLGGVGIFGLISEVNSLVKKMKIIFAAIQLFDLFHYNCRYFVLWTLKHSENFEELPREIHRHILEFHGTNDFTKRIFFWSYLEKIVLQKRMCCFCPYFDPFVVLGDRARMMYVYDRVVKNKKNIVTISTSCRNSKRFLGPNFKIAKKIQNMGVHYSVRTDQRNNYTTTNDLSAVYLHGEVQKVCKAFYYLLVHGCIKIRSHEDIFRPTVRFFEFDPSVLMEAAEWYFGRYCYYGTGCSMLKCVGSYGVTFNDEGERILPLLIKLSGMM